MTSPEIQPYMFESESDPEYESHTPDGVWLAGENKDYTPTFLFISTSLFFQDFMETNEADHYFFGALVKALAFKMNAVAIYTGP